MSRAVFFAPLLLLAPALGSAPEPPTARGWWGVALALHPRESARQGFAHPPDPAPLGGLGARHVLLAPTWVQADARSSSIGPGEVRDGTLRRVMRRARALGLGVVLMPHLVLARAAPSEWRGRIRPRDRVAWWRSYRRFVRHHARLAAEERAELFAIGSELTSMSGPGEAGRWRSLAAEVRGIYDGPIAWVANHDALERRAPLEAVDVIGVSAYFPLAEAPGASEGAMRRRASAHVRRLRALRAEVGKPLVLFELGYPSRRGGAVRPWDDASPAPADPETQRRAWAAMRGALEGEGALGPRGWLDGLFAWTWFGPGGVHDRHYTVRGKPAEAELRALLRAASR